MIKIFISYGHDDYADCAEMLKNALNEIKDKNGKKRFDVFKDERIGAGNKWDVTIEKKIDESQFIIYLMTKHSTDEDSVCRNEIYYALELGGKEIIPILIENVKRPMAIIRYQYIDWTNRDENCERIVGEILEKIDSTPLPELVKKTESENPASEHLHKTCWYFINKGDFALDEHNISEAKKIYKVAVYIAEENKKVKESYESLNDLSICYGRLSKCVERTDLMFNNNDRAKINVNQNLLSVNRSILESIHEMGIEK